MKKILSLILVLLLSLLCIFGCKSANGDVQSESTESSESSTVKVIEPSDYYSSIESLDSINESGDITLKISSEEFKQNGFNYNDFVVLTIRGQSIMVAVVPNSSSADENTDVLIVGEGNTKPILSVVGGDFALKYGIADQRSGEKVIMNEVTFPLEVGYSMAIQNGYKR